MVVSDAIIEDRGLFDVIGGENKESIVYEVYCCLHWKILCFIWYGVETLSRSDTHLDLFLRDGTERSEMY